MAEGDAPSHPTDTGGIGKTRPSLSIGDEVLDEYRDRWRVALASVSNPGFIVNTVAAVLDVRSSGDQTLMPVLTYYLRDHRALIVISGEIERRRLST